MRVLDLAQTYLLSPWGQLLCAVALFLVAQQTKRLALIRAWLEADPVRVRLLVLLLGSVPFAALSVAGSPLEQTIQTLLVTVLAAMGLHSAKGNGR